MPRRDNEQQERIERQNRDENLRRSEEQIREEQHKEGQKKEQQSKEKEQKDYQRYGSQGWTAEQVEILYKKTMSELNTKYGGGNERMQNQQEQLKEMNPQEKYKQIQEQNKDKMAQLEQNRQNEKRLEREGHER